MTITERNRPSCPLCGSPIRFTGVSGCSVECVDLDHTCPCPFGCNGRTPKQALELFMQEAEHWRGKPAASCYARHRTGHDLSWPSVVGAITEPEKAKEYGQDKRPAAAQKKRLKDEPWITPESAKFRVVFPDGKGLYTREAPVLSKDKKEWNFDEPYTIDHRIYDSTDWQNSLERRPE